ncbi:MAG TPA: hypothetical protein VFO76_11525, partial [Candidatus Kapabacteria bacterium]|nr:hypothetical protein [Candidatus Kapabacteria bacterium]
MKYFILVCLSAFLTIITIGCNDSNSSEGPNLPSSIKELFPLKVGDEWHYDVGNFDSVGNADR